ncbi:RDD family protein, partial [Candidatus Pelagibacter sp.]|nr:RDD family protein [Candidatus Pelagibacter sp.]
KKRYAGFWWRILAGLIDNIILAIISLALSFMGLPFIGFFIYWLYFVILQSSEKRSTLGMRVCDIKIHDEHFNKLGFWRLTGRYFATGLSGIILLIGFFMIAFTKRKQGLHDLVARTIHTIG